MESACYIAVLAAEMVVIVLRPGYETSLSAG